jgi:putative ABC transport system permease protein
VRLEQRLRTIPLRLRSLFRRARVEQDLDDELQFHVEQQAATFISQGVAPAEARARALRTIGGIEHRKQECRDARGVGLVEDVLRDARYAVRTLRRNRAFSAGALAILALGTGASAAVATVVARVLVAPLPFEDPARLVVIREVVPQMSGRLQAVNPLHFNEWRRQCRCFEDVALSSSAHVNLTGIGGAPERIRISSVTPNFFPLLRVSPRLGRPFLTPDADAGAERVVLISDGLWRRRFGADRGIVGRVVHLDGAPSTIIGVLPQTFRDFFSIYVGQGSQVDAYQPWSVTPQPWWGWAGNYTYNAVGRLREGVGREEALAELNVLQSAIAQRFERGRGLELRAELVPSHEWVTGESRDGLLLLVGAVGIAFLAACVNIANLMLARATTKTRETAVRTAIGASRVAIFRTVIVESAVLALAGTALGVALGAIFLEGFIRLAPPGVPRLDEIAMDWTALLAGVALFTIATLAFGVLPAVRTARADPYEGLRASSPSFSDGGGRLRQGLVSIEVALSVTLLVAAGLLLASFGRLQGVDRGFDAGGVLTANFNLPAASYGDREARLRFYDALVERLEGAPGIVAAGVTSLLPLRGRQWGGLAVPEGANTPPEEALQVQYRWVSPNYFRAMGLPLRAGRPILPDDRNRVVAVVSESIARTLWPQADAVGRRFSRGDGQELTEIVGVVPDVHTETLEGERTPIVYAPLWEPQGVPPSTIVVRTLGDARAAAGPLREAVAALDRDLPLSNVQTMHQVEAEVLAERRLQLLLMTAFAAASLLLAGIATYSVLAYAIVRRTREMAIRMALGAPGAQVRAMVFREGIQPVLAGVAIGVTAALLAGQLLSGLLYAVRPTDPVTFAAVVAVTLSAAAFACWLPARRLARTPLLNALRDE